MKLRLGRRIEELFSHYKWSMTFLKDLKYAWKTQRVYCVAVIVVFFSFLARDVDTLAWVMLATLVLIMYADAYGGRKEFDNKQRMAKYTQTPAHIRDMQVKHVVEKMEQLEKDYAQLQEQAGKIASDFDQQKKRTDRAYRERNNGVIFAAMLANQLEGWTSGWAIDPKEPSPDWAVLVFVESPDGSQVSWHVSPSEALEAKSRLPEYKNEWDGTFASRTGEFLDYV